jgi:hypothetical protein
MLLTAGVASATDTGGVKINGYVENYVTAHDNYNTAVGNGSVACQSIGSIGDAKGCAQKKPAAPVLKRSPRPHGRGLIDSAGRRTGGPRLLEPFRESRNHPLANSESRFPPTARMRPGIGGADRRGATLSRQRVSLPTTR